METKILYECDRRQCKKCYDYCRLTSNPKHAKNFRKNEDGILEEIDSKEKEMRGFREGLAASGRMI